MSPLTQMAAEDVPSTVRLFTLLINMFIHARVFGLETFMSRSRQLFVGLTLVGWMLCVAQILPARDFHTVKYSNAEGTKLVRRRRMSI